MTIIDENDKGLLQYNTLKLVEFLEYIARVADKRHEKENCDLASKIELVLDDMLPQFGHKRNPRG